MTVSNGTDRIPDTLKEVLGMEREWNELEPTLGNYLRLKAEILWVEMTMFFLRIELALMKTALWLLGNEEL